MADVIVVPRPSIEGKRLALVLTEDRVGHYPEFRDYFARVFDLDRIGLAEPGFVQAPSGLTYALVFIGRSGEPFPSGVEVYAVVDSLEPIDDSGVDSDLWAILEWMIAGVGAPWTVRDLRETGRLYRIPAVSEESFMPSGAGAAANTAEQESKKMSVSMTVNGELRTIMVEPRMTLLDALREELALTGTKKACDRGECGACTVHVEGRRVLSCMTLAAMQEGKRVTTVEGLERDGKLHPLQAAFIEHDGFQCGFCTSGQIMSGVAVIEEAKAGWASAATADVTKPFTLSDLSSAEIRERMSGNLCRCACYPNIVEAVADAVERS
jgi:xanthine dehydrogenase YagT iron-sulfur-binding subunit